MLPTTVRKVFETPELLSLVYVHLSRLARYNPSRANKQPRLFGVVMFVGLPSFWNPIHLTY